MTALPPDRAKQERLDHALEDTFPASDPPASSVPVATAEAGESEAGQRAQCAVYRVVARERAEEPFSLAQAYRSGRWTSAHDKAVYASLSPAGAVLEYLAHLEGETPDELVMVIATLPASCVQSAGRDLPQDWKERPYRSHVQEIGDRWWADEDSLALKVPSALSPREYNVLINPRHPDHGHLAVLSVDAVHIDSRLRY
ncbi:MAG: RES family NAD+ phosphorylase [Proteobacteria bacterium]|nr:RES family NAD+ phosphorylase [Pseudomonadota bacterium]